MPRILVAEDEPDIRELVKLTLQFSGYEVIGVNDGAEAIKLAQDGNFDLILLDVRMPRVSGYEACRLLRQLESTRATPIIMLSAKGQESEVKAGLDAGANEYILKPFAPADLTTRIDEILNHST